MVSPNAIAPPTHNNSFLPKKSSIGTSIGHWLVRGFAAGMMVFAAVNALSYFFLTDSFGNLANASTWCNERIGFPYVFWEQGKTYGGLFVDYSSIGLNVSIGAAIGLLGSVIAVANRKRFNQMIDDFETNEAKRPAPHPVQFSIKGLMLATLLCAVVVAAVTQWTGSAELLWFTYLFGPVTLIGIAYLPPGISWKKRIIVLTAASVVVIIGAIWTAIVRDVSFDKVAMGIFVFWTPQGAFASAILTTALILGYRRTSDPIALTTDSSTS